MRTEDICALPIAELADEQSVLIIWTTDAHIPDCLEVIRAWGFTYKTVCFHWIKKEKSGKCACVMGRWTMKSSEICLLATKGTAHKLLKARNVRQLTEAIRTKHSSKPKEVRDKIEKMFGKVSRIELFAREKAKGWHVWGNEITNNVDLNIG